MTESEIQEEEKTIPFFPDHLWTEAKVAIGILLIAGFIGLFAIWNPIGLGPQADPMTTPPHTQPEWYFLFLYELLKYIPKTLGVVIPIVLLVLITLWPFIDKKSDNPRAKRFRIILSAISLAVVIGLTLLAEFGS
jgi:quinol-cytochrome oxidoreductase complex cytochrome b subunit